ncbi:odorant receptor 85c-like [Photinus pyralis]|uniref:odorant receptor 85c-like n=1 Tax=Photinus pyralis TaxID=7054 RepID=UPI001266F311|nr:odorant receptor 85c-like [Photinus pyralis]
MSRSEKVTVGIYLLAVYLYCAMFVGRKFNLQTDIEDCFYLFGITNSAINLTLMRMNRSKLTNLLILLETSSEYQIKRKSELRSELERPLTVVGRLTVALGIAPYASGILVWLLRDNRNGLPYGSMPRWMNYNYTACLLFQVTNTLFLVIEYLRPAAIKICIMLQLKTHLKYLRMSTEEVLDDAKKEFCSISKIASNLVSKNNVPWPYQQKQLKRIIMHHNHITRIANETEEVFNKCVLVNFLSLSFLICIILFRIANAPLFTVEFFKMSIYFIGASALFFGDCFLTQRVLNENEALAFSCYNIDFVGTNLPFQKSLILIMARAQRSIRFTVGKFAPLSIVTLVTILKASYSYLMLLQNHRK